jgi:hypothetical protein
MARWRAHRCRGADPFGSDPPQERSAVHISIGLVSATVERFPEKVITIRARFGVQRMIRIIELNRLFAISALFRGDAMRGESEERTYCIMDCGPLIETNAANLLSTASRIAPLPASQLCPTQKFRLTFAYGRLGSMPATRELSKYRGCHVTFSRPIARP